MLRTLVVTRPNTGMLGMLELVCCKQDLSSGLADSKLHSPGELGKVWEYLNRRKPADMGVDEGDCVGGQT